MESRNVWSFDDSLSAAQKFRSTKPREYKYLQEFYVNTFIPYIREITNAHPEYTYEDLERHIKIDITKLSEAIFEGSDVYHIYLETIACEYLSKNPDKLSEILDEMVKPEYRDSFETDIYKFLMDHKDDPDVSIDDLYIQYVSSIMKPEYSTSQNVSNSVYGKTFRGMCMQYIIEGLPWYLEEKIDAENKIAESTPEYLSIIASEKAKGTGNKTIFDMIKRKYKQDYTASFIQTRTFDADLSLIVYGLQEYLRNDLDEKSSDDTLAKILRRNLKSSIVQINSQFRKFGFNKRAQDIRKAKFTELGIGDLADRLTAASYTDDSALSSAIEQFDLENLMAYNTFLTNRYSKEATSLAEAFFITYQYDLLRKFQDPEVERFFRLKDAMDSHSETDPSVTYVIDKNSEYPTKEDLFRALKVLYPLKPSYVAIRKRITSLPEARKDATKVSIPGLIHEIKQAYPTREEFETALERMQDFYPSQDEINLALDKMSFLFNPTKYFVNEVQDEIDTDQDAFESSINLTPEEELHLFGNISDNPNIIRYSQRPYLSYMTRTYGKEYRDYFDSRFRSLENYSGESGKEPPESDIESDASKYLRFYTPIFYSYKFKDNLINSLVALTLGEKTSIKNAGIILDSESSDRTTGNVKFITGIGIDANLSSPVQVHCIQPAISDFLQEFTGGTIIPIYEGIQDFGDISNQSVFPFTPSVKKYLKDLAKKTDLNPKAEKYVKRINSLSEGKIPDSVRKSFENGKPRKKSKFKRRYIDITTGEIYTMDRGLYVPAEPIEVPKIINPQSSEEKDGGYEI